MLASARFALLPLSLFAALGSAQSLTAPDALPSGVPLRIRVTHTAHLHIGAPVTGVLTEPVYLHDHLVLPQNTIIRGTVAAYAPVDRKLRAQALLNGDVTPLHDPVVDFDSLQLPNSSQQIAISSRGLMRDTQLVSFVARKKRPTYVQQGEDMVRAQVKSVHDTFFTPGRTDRALRLLYSQLPYHPQRIWAGTGFIAELNAPLDLSSSQPAPIPLSSSASLDSITVSARLDTSLNSATSKPGDPVTATVTQPVFDSSHNLLIPEGATLEGTVTRAKPARRLGRNGELRFGFRGLADEAGTTHVDGNVTGAAGAKGENLTVDDEGNVKANPDKGKVLAPLLLLWTASRGADDDSNVRWTVGGSNGFGLIARFVAFSNNKNVALGFGMYGLAKSVYFRYLDRGHQVTFPRDTEVEVQLVSRTETDHASAKPAEKAPVNNHL
ncbi:MAG TPA: hypothetical protein VGU25_07660 [Acidobacteriaceae bacterium]|nr:hypothetical protein [Acidobacteriaceae bacterium]